MTDQKDKQEEILKSNVESEVVVPKQEVRTEQEINAEKLKREDQIVSAELRREIEAMEIDDNAKAEAEKKAKKIEFLGEKEKVEHLLQLAREKGVIFAIQVARKMNEPYLLDILHDTLAQEGYYKDFSK